MKVEERSSLKCCATCHFWQGERQVKPNSYGQFFIVEDFRDARTVGVCGCGASRYCSRQMPANNVVCDKYRKWMALR